MKICCVSPENYVWVRQWDGSDIACKEIMQVTKATNVRIDVQRKSKDNWEVDKDLVVFHNLDDPNGELKEMRVRMGEYVVDIDHWKYGRNHPDFNDLSKNEFLGKSVFVISEDQFKKEYLVLQDQDEKKEIEL